MIDLLFYCVQNKYSWIDETNINAINVIHELMIATLQLQQHMAAVLRSAGEWILQTCLS